MTAVPSSIRVAPGVKVHTPAPPSVAAGLVEHERALTALRGLRDAALADVQRQFAEEEKKLKLAFDRDPAGFNATAYMNGAGRESADDHSHDHDHDDDDGEGDAPAAATSTPEKKRPVSAAAAKTASPSTVASSAATVTVTGAGGGTIQQAKAPKKAGGNLTLSGTEKMCRRCRKKFDPAQNGLMACTAHGPDWSKILPITCKRCGGNQTALPKACLPGPHEVRSFR